MAYWPTDDAPPQIKIRSLARGGMYSTGFGQGNGKPRYVGDGVTNRDEVVGKRDCLLQNKAWQGAISRFSLVSINCQRARDTLPRRNSGSVENSWYAFSFCSRQPKPKTCIRQPTCDPPQVALASGYLCHRASNSSHQDPLLRRFLRFRHRELGDA